MRSSLRPSPRLWGEFEVICCGIALVLLLVRVGGNGIEPDCVTTTNRDAAMTIYQRQFGQVQTYRLPNLRTARISVNGEIASVSTSSQIVSAAGALPLQPIEFALHREDGRWRIDSIDAKCR